MVASVAAAALALVVGPTPPARAAPIAISDFSVTPVANSATDSAGLAPTQAGAHPDIKVTVKFCPDSGACDAPGSSEDVRDLHVELPPGLIANTQALPHCTSEQFMNGFAGCPGGTIAGSPIGAVSIEADAYGQVKTAKGYIYNVESAGSVAKQGIMLRAVDALGNILPHEPVPRLLASVSLRATDAGLNSATLALPKTACSSASWTSSNPPCSNGSTPLDIKVKKLELTLYGRRPNGPSLALITNPTSCSPPATARVVANSYNDSNLTEFPSSFTSTGCPAVEFTPALDVERETDQALAPSGYTVTVGLPGNSDPAKIDQAHLERSEVTLPAGVGFNPGANLVRCDEAGEENAFNAVSDTAATCLPASDVGDITVATPLIDGDPSTTELDPLSGDVYLGPPSSDGDQLFAQVQAGETARVKLLGQETTDPNTGRVKIVFDSLPQIPFTSLEMKLRGGPNAILRNSATCGSAAVDATLTPWSGGSDDISSHSLQTTGCQATTSPGTTPPGTTTTPPPSQDVAVKIAGGPATVTRAGRTSIGITCVAQTASCKGALTLRTAVRVKGAGRGSRAKRKRTLTLGRGSFLVAAGQRSVVYVRLSRVGRRALLRLGYLKVGVTANPEGGVPAVGTVRLSPSKALRRKARSR